MRKPYYQAECPPSIRKSDPVWSRVSREHRHQESQETHHEAAGITDQKHGGAAVLFRSRKTLQHVLRGPVRFPLWELLEQLLHHGRHDVSWREGVDPNLVLAPFGRQVPPELYHASLRGIVGRANEALQYASVTEHL